MLIINKVIYKLYVYNFVSFLLFSNKIIQVKLDVAKTNLNSFKTEKQRVQNRNASFLDQTLNSNTRV